MSTKQILLTSSDITEVNAFLNVKYKSIYFASYHFPELTDQQEHFLLDQFWKVGQIQAFTSEGSKDELVLTPFAENLFNIYDYPINARPVNLRAVSNAIIPDRDLKVNEECVIGYAHVSHLPVSAIVKFYVDRLTDIEMTIDTALFNLKLPRLVICSPSDKKKFDDLMGKIKRGEHVLYLTSDDWQAIKNVLQSGEGNQTSIDLLQKYKTSVENELLTFLGVDNIGVEKQERLIVDEANANNDFINDNSETFLKEMKNFCERVTDVLGFKLSVVATARPVSSVKEPAPKEESSDEFNN